MLFSKVFEQNSGFWYIVCHHCFPMYTWPEKCLEDMNISSLSHQPQLTDRCNAMHRNNKENALFRFQAKYLLNSTKSFRKITNKLIIIIFCYSPKHCFRLIEGQQYHCWSEKSPAVGLEPPTLGIRGRRLHHPLLCLPNQKQSFNMKS